MAGSAPKLSFGTAVIASFDDEVLKSVFNTLEKNNVKELDSASGYYRSEEVLGKVGAPKRFTVSTKAPGFKRGTLAKQSVLNAAENSLKLLGVDSVDIYYLHSPDPSTPLEETLAAIQEVYAAGKFKRFGVSNFSPEDVQNIYDIQSATNSVLPTVYQGNYNAVSRHIETGLFPLLRKLNISFYAYSPIAGGFLTKNAKDLKEDKVDSGRFGAAAKESLHGKLYRELYFNKESLFTALDEWAKIAEDAKLSKAALAYRWIAYHSQLKKELGDAIIFGASKVSQLEETLAAIEAGPLGEDVAKRVDDIWELVEHEAPLDNYHNYGIKNL
ncbi:NADP-dependent oxidoreductase domain-containing protein [Bisporella sp. PMI_857]|nr:NADP-dependent oxidoreductase domain-containing protein [Bisporella sp. PMI_857]